VSIERLFKGGFSCNIFYNNFVGFQKKNCTLTMLIEYTSTWHSFGDQKVSAEGPPLRTTAFDHSGLCPDRTMSYQS
jgi:hypothetical protein